MTQGTKKEWHLKQKEGINKLSFSGSGKNQDNIIQPRERKTFSL